VAGINAFLFLKKSIFQSEKPKAHRDFLISCAASLILFCLYVVVSYQSVQRTEVGFTSFLFDGFTIALLDEKTEDTIFVQCSNFSISF
jgi:hypothetical protein